MVIDNLQDVSTPTLLAGGNETLTATSWISTNDLQQPTDMIHALHRDEKELQVLAVVLSLTGGLVLSFLLGVGIFVYWHWRAWRTRQRKKLSKLKNPASTFETPSPPSSLLTIRTDAREGSTHDLSPPPIASTSSSSPVLFSPTNGTNPSFHSGKYDRRNSSDFDMTKSMLNDSGIDRRHSFGPTTILPADPSSSFSSASPIPTAPPAKECLASSNQSSNQLSTLDPPDIPPPAYSPH